MHNLNTTVFYSVYQWAGKWTLLDQFFVVLTFEITYGVIGIILFYLLIIAPFRTQDPKERLSRLGTGFLVLGTLFLTFCTVVLAKILVAHPRPFVVLAEVRPLVNEVPFESFPSAHAAITLSLAIAVWHFHRRLGWLLLVFALIVGISRLYVGVHYPLDILGGFLIGWGIATGMVRLFRR